jgi:hypothetical protein
VVQSHFSYSDCVDGNSFLRNSVGDFHKFWSERNCGKNTCPNAGAISIIHATLFQTNRLKELTAMAGKWTVIATDFGLLWNEAEDKADVDLKQWTEFEALTRRAAKIDNAAFSVSKRRLEAAQREVMKKRGLG